MRSAILFASILCLAGCMDQQDEQGSTEQTAREILPVRTVFPETRDMDRRIEITGRIRALVSSAVAPRLSGVLVLELHKDAGDHVELGEVLATLDSEDLKLNLEEASAAVKEARINLGNARLALRELQAEREGHRNTIEQAKKAHERASAQAEKGALSEEALEAAAYEYDKEVSHLERLGIQIEKAEVTISSGTLAVDKALLAETRARQDLAHALVRAPFAGIIAERMGSPGQVSASGQALFTLFDPATMVVEAWLPQRDLRDLSRGLPARLHSEALGSEVREAVVSLVSPVIDQATGTVAVRLAPEDKTDLRPGLFVSGEITAETRRGVLAVPRKAVGFQRERPFLFRVDEGPTGPVVRRLWFTEGLSDGGWVEVVAPEGEASLTADDRVVLVGLDRLRDGDQVRIEVAAADGAGGD